MQVAKSVSEAAHRLKQDYPRRSLLLSMLQDAQEQHGFLPEEVLRRIADELRVPLADVYSVATFYKSFSLTQKGRNVITVCEGTACHVRGSARLVDELERWLGIKPGENTLDGVFSLETVNCLGCCALGPVMVVNGRYYSKMKPSRATSLLKRIRSESR